MSAPVSEDPAAGHSFGSLNNYSLYTNAFDSEDADTAILLTAHLGVLLQLATIARESTDRSAQLSDAVASRDVIGQAKGILMERERLTAAQAFDVLRAASQRLNRKLRDVADDLASSGESQLVRRRRTVPTRAVSRARTVATVTKTVTVSKGIDAVKLDEVVAARGKRRSWTRAVGPTPTT